MKIPATTPPTDGAPAPLAVEKSRIRGRSTPELGAFTRTSGTFPEESPCRL